MADGLACRCRRCTPSYADRERKTAERTNILQWLVLLFKLLVKIVRKYVQRARTNSIHFTAANCLPKRDQLPRLRHWQRLEHEPINKGKDRRVCANPHR